MSFDLHLKTFLPKIKYLAKKTLKSRPLSSDCYEDLIQSGLVGLFLSVRDYNSQKDVDIKTYAYHRIRGEMEDFLRGEDTLSRKIREKINFRSKIIKLLTDDNGSVPTVEEISNYLDIPIDKYLDKFEDQVCPEFVDIEHINDCSKFSIENEEIKNNICQENLGQILKDAMTGLNKREYLIINMYYFMDVKMSDIAEQFSVSQAMISKIHKNAIKKMRLYFSNQKISNVLA